MRTQVARDVNPVLASDDNSGGVSRGVLLRRVCLRLDMFSGDHFEPKDNGQGKGKKKGGKNAASAGAVCRQRRRHDERPS